jgi:hypothetical protein
MRADGPPPLVQARRLLPIAELEDLGGGTTPLRTASCCPCRASPRSWERGEKQWHHAPPSCRVAGVQRLMALRAARHRLDLPAINARGKHSLHPPPPPPYIFDREPLRKYTGPRLAACSVGLRRPFARCCPSAPAAPLATRSAAGGRGAWPRDGGGGVLSFRAAIVCRYGDAPYKRAREWVRGNGERSPQLARPADGELATRHVREPVLPPVHGLGVLLEDLPQPRCGGASVTPPCLLCTANHGDNIRVGRNWALPYAQFWWRFASEGVCKQGILQPAF